jgi:hypothetical protein
VLDVLAVLVVDVRHERVVAVRFLPCDLLVEGPLRVSLVGLRVRKGEGAAWAVVSLIEGLRTVKWEVLARKATSQSRLSSGLQVISSLVASGSLRSWQH